MNSTAVERLAPVATSQGLAAWFGRGIARALLADPLPPRPTEADETYWLVPEIEFGRPQVAPGA